MYKCESWIIKKTEHWRIDAFVLWSWGRLLRVHWTAWRSNQSILKINQPWIFIGGTWCWSASVLATRCEELTHWKRPWCWERLKAGKGGNGGWDGWMASLSQWTWVWSSARRWRTGKPGVLQGHKELGMTEELNNNNNKRYSPVVFKHGCSLGTYLELWRKKSNTCAFVFLKKFQDSRLPWWPSGQDSVIPMQGA